MPKLKGLSFNKTQAPNDYIILEIMPYRPRPQLHPQGEV